MTVEMEFPEQTVGGGDAGWIVGIHLKDRA